jgi:hypothetical protein
MVILLCKPIANYQLLSDGENKLRVNCGIYWPFLGAQDGRFH